MHLRPTSHVARTAPAHFSPMEVRHVDSCLHLPHNVVLTTKYQASVPMPMSDKSSKSFAKRLDSYLVLSELDFISMPSTGFWMSPRPEASRPKGPEEMSVDSHLGQRRVDANDGQIYSCTSPEFHRSVMSSTILTFTISFRPNANAKATAQFYFRNSTWHVTVMSLLSQITMTRQKPLQSKDHRPQGDQWHILFSI